MGKAKYSSQWKTGPVVRSSPMTAREIRRKAEREARKRGTVAGVEGGLEAPAVVGQVVDDDGA